MLAGMDVPIPVTRAATVSAASRLRMLAVHPYRPRPRRLPAPSGGTIRRVHELTGALTGQTPPTVVGPLSPDLAAEELLTYLRHHGYLDDGTV